VPTLGILLSQSYREMLSVEELKTLEGYGVVLTDLNVSDSSQGELFYDGLDHCIEKQIAYIAHLEKGCSFSHMVSLLNQWSQEIVTTKQCINMKVRVYSQ